MLHQLILGESDFINTSGILDDEVCFLYDMPMIFSFLGVIQFYGLS
jgi:hypothetical protein